MAKKSQTTKPETTARTTKFVFNDDVAAWDPIKYTHGVTRGGIIYPYDPARKETPRQTAAINYLCEEWDYDYAAAKPEEM